MVPDQLGAYRRQAVLAQPFNIMVITYPVVLHQGCMDSQR